MSHGNEAIQPTQEQLDQEYQRIREVEEELEIEFNNNQNLSDMNTGTFTSTVKRIESIKEWGEGDQKTLYHNLEMDNGDKINAGKKKELKVGDTVNYEIVEVGQQEYAKTKYWNPDYNSNGNSAPRENTQTSTITKQTNQGASFCLAYAKDVYVAHGGQDPSNEIKDVAQYITGLADELLTWLESK